MNTDFSGSNPTLCIDIGSCTQDALLLLPGESPVNATRFVLPSPAVLLARDIARKIEGELKYPGQIKVHLLRETKAIEYAK